MPADLRSVYKNAGALDRYFDKEIPVDLFRGQRKGDSADLLQPTLIGWNTATGPRLPDILLEDPNHASPQYNEERVALQTEGKGKPLTAKILQNTGNYIVKGCRTMSGPHRGISVFDKHNPKLTHFDWHRIPQGAQVPDALAVTRDSTSKTSLLPIRYTIAPER